VALDVDGVDTAGTWLHHIPHAADPRSRPSPAGDNRWQRGAVIDALYLAADTANRDANVRTRTARRPLPCP
jgi:hypothetical protein